MELTISPVDIRNTLLSNVSAMFSMGLFQYELKLAAIKGKTNGSQLAKMKK